MLMNFKKIKISLLSICFKILFLFCSLNAFSSENLDYYDLYQKGDYNAAFRSAYKVSVTSDEPKAKYATKERDIETKNWIIGVAKLLVASSFRF